MVIVKPGVLLCACLVTCNLAVMRVLLSPVNIQKKSHVLVRRISRNRDLTYNASTSEELAFAKVMGLLCLVFVICWLPQLFTVPIAQMYPRSPRCHFYVNLADGILALHFVVDPYLYVLQRWACFRSICRNRSNSRGCDHGGTDIARFSHIISAQPFLSAEYKRFRID